MNFDYSHSFLGLVVLILDLWAIISVISSNSGVGKKVLWTLIILFLPFAGFLIWALIGPRAKKA